MSEESKVCGSCRFWQRPEGAGPGQCRHRSPRAIEHPPQHWRSQWPPTWGLDWCGQWREHDPDPGLIEEPTHERA